MGLKAERLRVMGSLAVRQVSHDCVVRLCTEESLHNVTICLYSFFLDLSFLLS